jgi:hypothetical protein
MPTESQLRDTALRLRVRELLQNGRLPAMLPKEIYAGYGEGNECLVCGQPITATQVEYEVAYDGSRLRLHLGCHVIWQMECHKRIAATSPRQPGQGNLTAR